MVEDFLHRHVRALGRPVHRIGLATSYGLEPRAIEAAFERGIDYVFWTPTSRTLTKVLRGLSAERKARLALATGPTLGFTASAVRRRVERVLRLLSIEQLAVLQLYWLGRTSALRSAVVDEMVRLRDEGKVRALGASIHDRERAGLIAREGPLDLLMIRYNAAHPGAEQDIFPHLAARQPAVVAYTATAWRRLLRRPSGWEGPVPSAADCYRFCLSNEHVDVVLMGAASGRELEENLRGLARGPMSADELAGMRSFGRVVHG